MKNLVNAVVVDDVQRRKVLAQIISIVTQVRQLLVTLQNLPTPDRVRYLWVSKIQRATNLLESIVSARPLLDCNICSGEKTIPVRLECNHEICIDCAVKQFLENSSHGVKSYGVCPMCRAPYTLHAIVELLELDIARAI